MLFGLSRLGAISALTVFLLTSTVCIGGPVSNADAVTIAGRPLKHLGTGLREYLFLDIYKMDAYSESGACTPNRIVYDSEAKMIRLTMQRHVPLGYVWWQVKKAFEEHMPKTGDVPRLKKKISAFLALFKKDLAEGTSVEISYVPGKGITVSQNGLALGPSISGRDFQELTWRALFGGDNCCEKMIIEQCLQASRQDPTQNQNAN